MKRNSEKKRPDINEIGLLPRFRGFWNQVEAKGRTWGLRRNGENPYFGSHFAFIDKDEIVLLVGERKDGGRLKIFQFRKAENTDLGRKLLRILSGYGIEI